MNFKYRAKQLILWSGDTIGLVLALFLSLALRQLGWPSITQIAIHLPLLWMLIVVWTVSNYINGLYDLGKINTADKYRLLTQAGTMSLVMSVITFYLFNTTSSATPKTVLVLTVILGYGLATLWRQFSSNILALVPLHTRIILIGYTPETAEVIELLKNNPDKGYSVTALFDPDRASKAAVIPKEISVYSTISTLRAAITTHKAHTVIPAPGFSNHPDTVRELYELLFWPVRIMEFSTFYETITGRVPAASYSDGWFISNLVNRDQQLYDSVRRVLDYAVGIGMGILFITLFPFIALAIKTNSKGPILFKQKRMGWRSTTFTIQKFRTMYALAADGSAETEGAVFAQKNDDRITKVGTFLRKTRLDELPQFWNLLRGDISLIGPRPERPEIFAKLETAMPYYHLRLLVKPGITGWAAINQHYAGTIDEAIQKLQYDLYYIKNRSALLDLVIVLRTINVVLRMMGQ